MGQSSWPFSLVNLAQSVYNRVMIKIETVLDILQADGIREEEKIYYNKLSELIKKHKELLAIKGLS